MKKIKFIKNLLLLAILQVNLAVIAQIPTEGLIGYWPFNGNADDVSGNNNNGILECESNLPQPTTDRFGNPNSAYQFGGYYNKNWIRVPNNSTMHLNSQMTIAFWFQQCEFSGMNGYGSYSTTNAGFSLVTKAGDGIAAYPGLWINSGINAQTGKLNIGSANKNVAGYYEANYEVSVEYNCFDTCEWMHYVTVIDDNVARVYINGVLYRDTIINHADYTQANVQDLYFGRMGCNGFIWYPFYGKLDDIAFYNRALTEAEVAQLFDNYYDPHFFDNQIIIENLIVQQACNGNDGSVQVFVNPENGPFQYALDHPTNFQNSNLLENISGGMHRIYVKSECGLKDTIVDFTCWDIEIPLPDNIDSANCVFFPTATEWSIGSPIISNVGNAVIVSTPMVGDIDNDGQQEIVIPSATYSVASQLNIYNANGTLKSQFNIAGTYIWNSVGLARVKWSNNSFKNIIVVFGTNKYLYAYDANGTQLWQSNQPFSSHNWEESLMPAISFADFNHDGWTEVFIGSEIFDAATGVLLCKANGNKGCADRTWSWDNTPYQTMAADLWENPNLDLAIGNTVYNVDIQSRTDFSANQITVARQLPSSAMTMEDGSQIPFTDGNTFLADINLDGSLDVIVMNEEGNSRVVYLYVWDVATNTIICSKKITNARKFGTPQIGDLDNNGYPEICFITGTYSDHGAGDNDKIYALKYNPSNSNGAMDVFWSIAHDDDSGSTGLTMFDFNQDGYVELVYRDRYNLRIINGSLYNHQTGQPVSQPYNLAYISCCSATGLEYPVIADVDLDGEVEIVVGGETYGTDYGHVYIFKSGGIPWAPARKVWNQYMYNVTNVNMDLTIPEYFFNNATSFTDPQGVVRRPFNNFLQQATTIDQYGRSFYAVPDVAVLSANITTGGGNATLNVTYTNQGDNTFNAPYYITVFANQFGGEVVQTITVNTPLAVGGTGQQSITLPMSVLCQLENVTNLVVAINCNGGGIAQDGNLQPECDITNNTAQVSINLQSEPTTITETACDQYVWYGQTYTQSGQYETTIQNTYGCDSTLVLNLTIHYSDTIDYNISTCESYTWHDQTYSQSGDYTYNGTNEYGCNHLENLHLTISEGFRQEDEVTECDSYQWPVNQQWYYQSVLDSIVTQGSQGACDSTFVLNLTLHYSDTLDLPPVTTCDAYEWHGMTYTESGLLTYQTTNEYGCSRLERLDLTISDSETIDLPPVTECDQYIWHGLAYTESGIYTFDTVNQYGCLMQYILPLTINHNSENEFSVTSCEPYQWYGTVYDEPGTYTHTLTNSQGCDSLLIMHLDISETFMMEESIVSCGEYEWHGTVYTQGGDYQIEVENPDACDSIFILHLTIAPTFETEMEAEACRSYVWVNEVLTQSGDYERHFSSIMGCDSLVTLHLTINDAVYHDFVQETCLSVFTWNGITYYEDGDYEQTLAAENGCDSIVTMHLHFDGQYNTEITVNTCEDVYTWNGIDYFESGVYQQSFLSSTGCDSIVNLNLEVVESYEINIDTMACGAYKWGDEWLTVSGNYQSKFTTSNGCDSIVNLHLMMGIIPTCSIQGTTSIYPATDVIAGVYPYYIDSTGINPAHVHWSIDRDDWLLVPHNASCDLLCLSIGQGILRAWTEDEPCNIDTTLVLNATFFDISENGQASLKLYPNPSKGKITVEWDEIKVINVYDMLGQKLMACEYGKEQVCVLDLSHLQHSVYVLEVVSSAGRIIRPFVLTQ